MTSMRSAQSCRRVRASVRVRMPATVYRYCASVPQCETRGIGEMFAAFYVAAVASLGPCDQCCA